MVRTAINLPYRSSVMQNVTEETLNYQRKKKIFECSHLEEEEVAACDRALGWCQRA